MKRALAALAHGLELILKPFEALATGLAIVILLMLLVLTNVEVAGRYFLSYSTLVADEFGGYAFSWIVLLGMIHLLRTDRFLTMMLIVDRLPRFKPAFDLLAAAVGLAVSLVLLSATYELVRMSWLFGTRSVQASATPLVLPQCVLPFGYALLSIAFAEDILRRLAGKPPRRDVGQPAAGADL